jgi:hypothetical protein
MKPSHVFAIVSGLSLAGCAGQVPPTQARAGSLPTSPRTHPDSAILIFATDSGALRYWPIRARGGLQSKLLATLQNVGRPNSMASDGDIIAIGVTSPPSVVLYDINTMKQTNIADPYGVPSDVAFDKQGNILTINRLGAVGADVVAYTSPQYTPAELTCPLINSEPAYIAADRHGDIFVNANSAVTEIPKGPNGYNSQHCSQLPFHVNGYSAGLLVDPKNDALVVFDDPDECAGGNEANMTTYQKPYGRSKPSNKRLGPICASTLRFGPDDDLVFFFGGPTEAPRGDGDYSSDVVIHQRTYPDAKHERGYHDPQLGPAFAAVQSGQLEERDSAMELL